MIETQVSKGIVSTYFDKLQRNLDIDVAILTEHLCLAAAEQELGSCWVCNFDAPRVKELFGLAESVEPVVLLPLGYPAEGAWSEKKRKESILF